MKTYTKEELDEILRKHKLWLEGEEGGERADLTGAVLTGAVLTRADLTGADLTGADLTGADLTDAVLTRATVSVYTVGFALSCPDTGAFIGWKKAHGKIVKLLIPVDAKRSSATGRKCRCSKATVLAIENIDGSKAECDSVASNCDSGFVYKIGNTVEVANFCEDRWKECAPGIHFFITRQEAVLY